MEFNKIISKTDKSVFIKIAAGHFATRNSHINQYVDLTDIKSRYLIAKHAAAILAGECSRCRIDSIVCMEGTGMLGALTAQELMRESEPDNDGGICVLTPELDSNNKMVFLQNTMDMVCDKSVMLMLSSVSTGKTIERAVENLSGYGASIAAICAVFSAIRETNGVKINSVFTELDLPDYRVFATNECEMCANNRRIDAIVKSFGFSEL